LLEGGRNSLLESAQEATLTSVATVSFPRQSNRLAIANGMNPEEAEAAGGLILRGEHCFVCLNAYPYTSGHVMVMPYAHLDRLALLPAAAAHELIELAQRTEQALERLYHPHGFNFGMNLGQAAGAGVAGHLHLHALPRWAGDTNFMTTVARRAFCRKIWRRPGNGCGGHPYCLKTLARNPNQSSISSSVFISKRSGRTRYLSS
jgi:diadenosine tetraphosphate (Ap4A) HIT family hydrolase